MRANVLVPSAPLFNLSRMVAILRSRSVKNQHSSGLRGMQKARLGHKDSEETFKEEDVAHV